MSRLGIALALLLASCLVAAPEHCLVREGRAESRIVIAADAPRMTRLAAEQLQLYLRRMSDAELAIAHEPADGLASIYVGRSAHTDRLGVAVGELRSGAYRMVSGDGWLALLGQDADFVPPQPYKTTYRDHDRVLAEWDERTSGKWLFPHTLLFKSRSPKMDLWDYDERGSFNAVCGYLHSLGVRWYMQGDLGEVVPRHATIPLPRIDRVVRPDFAVRHLGPYAPVWIGNWEESILWRLRLGLAPSRDHLGLAASRWLGHGICLAHGRDETRRDHPEYFALYDGVRCTGGRFSAYGKPCLSSPGLFEANVRFVRDFFRIYPDEPMVSVMPADAYTRLCECPLCAGKGDPERAPRGHLSDYVWSYVNRVAEEVAKTHPDRKIVCFAYGSYLLPPKRIAKLSPNLAVGFCQHRADFGDPATERLYLDARAGWLEKLTSGEFYVWEYYLHSRPGRTYEGLPVFFPHAISRDLKRLKGHCLGEMVELTGAQGTGVHAPAFNHLNAYVTARLYWDADLDADTLLAEYFRDFYGPAADQMQELVAYAEGHWRQMLSDPVPVARTLDLLAAARQVAGESVYGRRIDLLAGYLEPLRQLRARLEKGRADVPSCRVLEGNAKGLTLDGRLDDPCWEGVSSHPLRETETGRQPYFPARFRMFWDKDALHLGIHCQDLPGRPLNSTGTTHDDPGIWEGDTIEILLETQTHSYYQIAINPAGVLVDADRSRGIDTGWSSGAAAAVHMGEDHWSIELRLPLAKDGKTGGISGRRPSDTYPWFLNVCRQRARPSGTERSAFSPTGEPGFHVPARFGMLTSPR